MHESYSYDMLTNCLNTSNNVSEKPAKSVFRVEDGYNTFLRQSSKVYERYTTSLPGRLQIKRTIFLIAVIILTLFC